MIDRPKFWTYHDNNTLASVKKFTGIPVIQLLFSWILCLFDCSIFGRNRLQRKQLKEDKNQNFLDLTIFWSQPSLASHTNNRRRNCFLFALFETKQDKIQNRPTTNINQLFFPIIYLTLYSTPSRLWARGAFGRQSLWPQRGRARGTARSSAPSACRRASCLIRLPAAKVCLFFRCFWFCRW